MAIPRELYIDAVKVYENSGSFYIDITSNGVNIHQDGTTIWTYSSGGTFLGLATTRDVSAPNFSVGDTTEITSQMGTYLFSVEDLTDTTWAFYDSISVQNMGTASTTYNINVKYNNNNYTKLYYDADDLNPCNCMYSVTLFNNTLSDGVTFWLTTSPSGSSDAVNFLNAVWEIKGGTDATNNVLTSWIETYATQVYTVHTWKLKRYIANTVPGSLDYLHLYFDYYCELTAADMSNCCNFVAGEILTPFSTWQELVVQLPDALEEFGATNVTSTLSASSIPADYKTKWSASGCGFWGNSEDGYWFGPDSGIGDVWTITEYPNVTGTISFTFDGDSYNLNFTQLLQAIIDVTTIPLFDNTVWIYDREFGGYTCEGMRTITITGGDDAEDVDLLAWLQANAVEVVPFTEGVRITYNGDVIRQQNTDGTFALACANKLMASNITIETLDVGSIVVTYDNDTIIDSSGTHTYQLPCNKKMADTDIVVTLVMTILPDNLLVTSEGNYIVDVSEGYLITAPPPSGYSGNITFVQKTLNGGNNRAVPVGNNGGRNTRIKFGSAPSSYDDFDSQIYVVGLTSPAISRNTTYSNETKVYVWGDSSGVTINGSDTNGSSSYDNAVEITLTGNYDIALWYYPYETSSGGTSN